MKANFRILTTLAVAGMVGCGGGPEQTVAVGGTSGDELAQNQVLRWGNGAEPGSLDPHRTIGVPGSNISRDLFEGLMSEAPDGTVIGGAAASWEISEDGKTYRFSLRPEARWSNGDPVTADDFVYSLRRSLDPATLSSYTFILNPILNAEEVAAGQLPTSEVGVRALDTHTLEIQLENATPYFLGATDQFRQLSRSSAQRGNAWQSVRAPGQSGVQWRLPARGMGRAIPREAGAQRELPG